jgi:hypothetical protein
LHTEVVSTSSSYLLHPLKLISTLWASAPNLPTPGAFPAAAVDSAVARSENLAAVPTEQILAPQGICGWVSAEPGAAGNFVCQAAGQVMPGIVFLVSLAVFSVTFIFLVRYLLRSAALASQLESAAKAIEKMRAAPADEWPSKVTCTEIVSALRDSGKSSPPIRELSNRIEKALIELPSPGERKMMLKRPVSEITSEIRGAERWSGQALAEALPSWLTGIGLLTTFVAILLGLQGVKVLTTLEVRGIGGLVNGLSGKFFSSIIALGCAITVTIIQYFVSGRSDTGWARLRDCLEERIPHLSLERVFVDLLKSRDADRGRL